MFGSGLPADASAGLHAAAERAFAVICAAAERLAALAPPGSPRPPALMMALHIWSMSHGVASLFARGDAARRKLPMSAEELLEAEVLIYLPAWVFWPTAEPRLPMRPIRNRRAGHRVGAAQNNLIGPACAQLDKNQEEFRYVNVIYIHNGMLP